MTGRDLIIYILKNGLEDEPIFKDGRFTIFKTVEELALYNNCGIETAKVLAFIDGAQLITAEGKIYILGVDL